MEYRLLFRMLPSLVKLVFLLSVFVTYDVLFFLSGSVVFILYRVDVSLSFFFITSRRVNQVVQK